jgi:hypothetical protein
VDMYIAGCVKDTELNSLTRMVFSYGVMLFGAAYTTSSVKVTVMRGLTTGVRSKKCVVR